MPSALQRFRPRVGGNRLQEQAQLSQPELVSVRPTWGGYCPDLAPELTDWRDAAMMSGLVSIGGRLRSPPGFERLDPDSLPLGTNTPPAGAGNEEPVVGIYAYRDALVSGGTNRRYAVTADDTLGHLYELSGNWTNIPAAAAAVLTGNTGGAGVAQTLADFASFPTDNLIIIANGFNVVFKHTPGGANYAEFSPAVLNPFIARTVCTFADRICFLNTSESGTVKPYRFRYTTTEASAPLTGSGSGFIDFLEVESEGTALRRLGNFLAAYFKRGTVLLRRTGDPQDPFRFDYASTKRGVLGPFAVTDVGPGRHFGIFNDGWFYLEDDGQFTEVGLRSSDFGVNHKWKRTFYNNLNTEQAGRTFVQRDPLFDFYWILWADTTSDHPNRVWIYVPSIDAVFPQDGSYTTFPNVIALSSTLSDTTRYADGAGLTYDQLTESYSNFEVKEGLDVVTYGTRTGLVLAEDPRLFKIDGVAPNYSHLAHPVPLGRPDLLKMADRTDVVYAQQAQTAPDIGVSMLIDENTFSQSIEQRIVAPGTSVTDYVNFEETGALFALGLAGQHPAEFITVQPHIRYTGGKVVKP